MATYRRTSGWGYKKWHFCKNCRNWPEHNYDETSIDPRSDDVCPNCKKLEAARNCRKAYSRGI